uniref:Uncharacterized protein n=1 Tax=Arundo donax TaxID=35708 RepID=A0A0A9F7A4_ARUDO
MPTSFAPSPIAKVVCPIPSLTSRVTNAFCFGDTRQHMTEAHSIARFKNMCFMSSSKANAKAFPSIIRANAASGSFSSFTICDPLAICNMRLSFATFFASWATWSPVGMDKHIRFMPCLNKLHAYPMLIAVSILSPVRTQILRPACAKRSMH